MTTLIGGFFFLTLGAGQVSHSVDFRTLNNGGVVPDAKTARAIAEAVWTPIYGSERIQRQKPLSVRLSDGVWVVSGTLRGRSDGCGPRRAVGMRGGTAYAEISKLDGRILRITHGK
ncbi:MAG: YbbC/YhhH family protein [Fimbriimonas sp.]